jgi:1-acyl-sn-glycerol-3-phosphate acyltransferase
VPYNHNRKPTLLSRLVRRIILAIWYVQGWKVSDPLPHHLKKYVLAGAPHTSNWDFVFFTGATHEEGVKPNFMGKHTLFQGIMKNFMFDMGGIPVDRRSRQIGRQVEVRLLPHRPRCQCADRPGLCR